MHYRNYKNFTNKFFRENIDFRKYQISVTEININNKGFDKFFKMCGKVLDRHARRKKKYNRGNQSLFMNKISSKEIMKRTKLRSNFLINKAEKNRKKNTPSKVTFVYHYKKKKPNDVDSPNEKNITDNRKLLNQYSPIKVSQMKT